MAASQFISTETVGSSNNIANALVNLRTTKEDSAGRSVYSLGKNDVPKYGIYPVSEIWKTGGNDSHKHANMADIANLGEIAQEKSI